MTGKKQTILAAIFLCMPFFSCAKVYIDHPDKEWTQRESRDKEFYREEIRKMEETHPERYNDRQRYLDKSPSRYESRRNYQPLSIRQGLEKMAEIYNLNPEEFSRVHEEAASFSKSENYRIWENLRLRILQNDGSVNRIKQGYTRISGWIHETRVSGQIIAIFIPASKNFVLGIIEEQIASSKEKEQPPTSSYRNHPKSDDIPMRTRPESANREENIVEEVGPVSDEEAEEYYRRQQKGGQ